MRVHRIKQDEHTRDILLAKFCREHSQLPPN